MCFITNLIHVAMNIHSYYYLATREYKVAIKVHFMKMLLGSYTVMLTTAVVVSELNY